MTPLEVDAPGASGQVPRQQSGLSQLQRRILRLALAVNIETQGVVRVKTSAPADLRSALALWVLGGARLDKSAHGFFKHCDATRSAKASITRATTRLVERGLLAVVASPGYFPTLDYVLTAQGLSAAGSEPLGVQHLATACMLFGVTQLPVYDRCHHLWSSHGPDDGTRQWQREEERVRKAALMDELMREFPNGYQDAAGATLVTVVPVAVEIKDNGYQRRDAATLVTVRVG